MFLFVWVLTYSIPRPKLSAPPSNHRFNICSKTRLPSSQLGGGRGGQEPKRAPLLSVLAGPSDAGCAKLAVGRVTKKKGKIVTVVAIGTAALARKIGLWDG